MRLEQVFDELLGDLPWMDNVRLVVGGLGSREAVKDQLLARAEAIPATAAGTLYEFVVEILKKNKGSVDKSREFLAAAPMTVASRCDALERIAASSLLRESVPELCAHLKTRQVAQKIARFVTGLERFYVEDGELDALVEYFQARDPSLGAFVKVVTQLWAQGELMPWGEGAAMRALLSCLRTDAALALPKKLWLWGFLELTPLEEALLGELARREVQVRWLVPQSMTASFVERASSMGIEVVALAEASGEVEVWEPHSVWDELERLRDELERLRCDGVGWHEIAIFLPNDDLYKRIAREKLMRWNVPLLDPTLSGAWRDQASWMWWRDLLRALSSGLKADDVRAWLGADLDSNSAAECKLLFDETYRQGVHGSAAQWARLAKKPAVESLAITRRLQLLIEGIAIFGRSMRPAKFLEAAEKFVPRLIELAGEREGTDLFLEFARHLAEERPYLENFSARLPRYVPLFEEFLDAKSRTQSLRNPEGVRFVAHDVWLPERPRFAFVLGASTITRAKPSADAWDWEGEEVRKLWNRLHFGLSLKERVLRDEAFLEYGLKNHGRITCSATEYDVSGAPLPRTAFYERIKGELQPTFRGGHVAVGWVSPLNEAGAVASIIERPDLSPAANGDAALRVSSFEDYLKCPFLYFARHVLGLDAESELGLDPDNRARGTILHKVLEKLLREEIDGRPLESLEDARARIARIVDGEIARHSGSGQSLPGMYRHQPLIDKAKAVIKGSAERWAEWELENRKKHPDVKPFRVEEPMEYWLSEKIKLRGKADRVDSDGKHSVVIDYKSGGAPLIGRELLDGIGAQLLMYSAAVSKSHGLEPGAAFYLQIGSQVKGTNGVFLKKHQKALHSAHARNSGLFDGEFSGLFERVTENWERAAQSLARGDFAPRPARPTKDCPNCSFQELCGYDARAAAGKEEE